jgi:pyruvate/2-oxoglutarate dehydrogenase complex dihydrolipoamide acyltransferase (E2) component
MTTPDTMARPATRLSPKVRSLLRQHGLGVEDVPGSGAGGRVTPHDVLRVAGDPGGTGRAGGTTVLASPLARRILRESGVDPAGVQGSGPRGCITRADADRAVRGVPTQPAPATPAAVTDHGARAVEVDLTRLLVALAGVQDTAVTRTGAPVPPLAALVVACYRALRHHPALASSPADDAAARSAHVDLGVAVEAGDRLVAPPIPAAQDLNVLGLSRRIADLRDRARRGEVDTDARSTFVVADAGDAPGADAQPTPASGGALLVLGPVQARRTTSTDALGMEVVSTRHVATLRLAHDLPRFPDDDADAFLRDLVREVESGDLLVGLR